MRVVRYIWFLILSLGLFSGLSGQYVNIVCTGDTGVIYKVKGNPGSTFIWQVDGGTIVSDWGDSIAVNWGETNGEFDISVQEFSIHDCPAVPVSGSVLVSAPDIELGSDIEICAGDYIEIEPTGTFYSYLWQDGSTNTTLITSTEGYKVLTVSDQYGCLRSDSVYLTVNPLPIVDIGPDTVLCGIEQLTLNAGYDGIEFNWSTGEIFQEITVFEGAQTIWVEVIDENSCISYDTMIINACSPEERFKEMPNAFSPNGDGDNDIWRIPQILAFPDAVVEIFDRWGKLVFRSEPGYSNPWNGISHDGREMPVDSYYFVIDLGDGSDPIIGNITLIR